MKKRILTAVAIIAVVALSLFLAACDGEEVLFRVIADYNAEQGTVTVTDADGKAKSEFGAGAQVVVKVEAGEGYEVDRFLVNGVDAELNNGIYAFYASSNTLVKVTFKESDGDDPDPDDDKTPEELFAAAFDSVKTTFKASGPYTYQEEGYNPTINSITTVFGDGAVNIVETDNDTGEILHDDVYVDKDGKIAMPYRTINNEIAYYYAADDEAFDEYGNPFKLLAATDFTETDIKNVFELTAKDKATVAATALTGYTESIASFTVMIGDGKVTRINISTERIKRGTGETEYYYTSVYSFTLSEWGTAEVDEEALTPYKTTAAHTALKEALEKASQAKNYTVGISELGLTELDIDLDYDIYVTETAVYFDCAGWEEGYVEKNLHPDDEDGTLVYHFRIGDEEDGQEKDGKVVIGDAVNYPTVKSMCASFGGFAPEILTNDGDVYTLQPDCVDLTGDVLVNFADGADNIMLYRDYSFNMKITLKDGELYQVELYYYTYGALVMRTMTYYAWDDTEMPLDFDDYVKESVLDEYVGTYTDQTIVVKVTSEGITINNSPFVITDYSVTQQMFTGLWNNQECYILYMTAKQLAVSIGNKSYIVTNIAIDNVTIPEEFNGVWTDGDNSVTVAYNKAMFGSNMLKVLSYDETEGLVALRGNVTYKMVVGELQGQTVLSVRTLTGSMTSQSYTMTKEQDGFIIPQTFVGTYAAFYNLVDYKVVITLNGVTVQISNKQNVATGVSVGNDGNMGTVINFKLNGVEYVITKDAYSSKKINLYQNGSVVANLPKTEDDDPATPPTLNADIPEAFYGSYMYIDISNHVFYSLYIDESGIVASIDMSSNEYDAEILEFDEEDDFMITVSINGKTYYLFGSVDNTNDDGKYNIITFMNDVEGDGSVEVKLLRYGYKPEDPDEQPPTFDIPANFIGVYEGTKNGDETNTKYVLTITATEMTLKVGDNEPVKVNIKNYEATSTRTKFTVIISGMGFNSVQSGVDMSTIGDTLIDNLYLMGDGIVSFTRVTESADNA